MSQQTLGRCLREAREAIPASLYQASRETKIRLDYLEKMEQDNFRFVSGTAYIKGMLRSYGTFLKIDGDQLCDLLSLAEAAAPEASVTQVVREPARIPPRKRPHWVLAAMGAAGVLALLAMIGVMKPADKVAAPPEAANAGSRSPQPAGLLAAGALGLGAEQAVTGQAAEGQAPVVQVPGQDVKLTLTVIGDRSWVEAFAGDGTQPIYRGTLASGSAKTFEAKDRLSTLIGNLGAVRLSVNGRDLGVAGRPGQVGKFVFDSSTTTLSPPSK